MFLWPGEQFSHVDGLWQGPYSKLGDIGVLLGTKEPFLRNGNKTPIEGVTETKFGAVTKGWTI